MNSVLLSLGYAGSWGVGQTLSKIALAEISPGTLLIVQLGSSVAFLAALYGVRYRRLPFTVGSLRRGGAGVFEPALAYMFGTFGLSLTTASAATLIGASEVVLTVVFAALVLREPLTRELLLLSALSFAGICLLFVTEGGGTGEVSPIGNLLVLLGTLFAVIYALSSKKAVAGADPLQLTAAQQLVGLFTVLLCFGALSPFRGEFAFVTTGVSPPFWLLAVVSGVLQYALGFLLYLTALRKVPVSRAAFYVALIPVFGVGSAALLLGERPGAAQWLGAALIIGASAYANRVRSGGGRGVERAGAPRTVADDGR